MKPSEILELANHPDVPKFVFGSDELKAWTQKHRNPHTGECIRDSGLYVVLHRSLNPEQRPDFRVLSNWIYGRCMPISWDVPAESQPNASLASMPA